MSKEFIFNELGFFTEKTAKNIAKKLNGKTYMRFNVAYSKYRGDANCTLFVSTNYFDDETTMTYKEIENAVQTMFYSLALNELGNNNNKGE